MLQPVLDGIKKRFEHGRGCSNCGRAAGGKKEAGELQASNTGRKTDEKSRQTGFQKQEQTASGGMTKTRVKMHVPTDDVLISWVAETSQGRMCTFSKCHSAHSATLALNSANCVVKWIKV